MADEPEVVRLLEERAGDESVAFQTRAGGALGATRFFFRPVLLDLEATVARLALAGTPAAALPGNLAEALEGYRVRAALGPMAGVPEIAAAGVAREVPPGFPALASAYGYAYVTTRWVAGTPLGAVRGSLTAADRRALLDDLHAAVADLHAAGVAHNGIEEGRVVIDGGRPWLVELASLRRPAAADREAAFAADREALARLAQRLAVDAPRLGAVARDTIVVGDGPLVAAAGGGDETIIVPDPPEAGGEGRRRPLPWAAIVLALVLSAAVAAALWGR